MPNDLPQPTIQESALKTILPAADKPKKFKIVLAVLGLFFVLASVLATVYLVKQRQEIRKMAVSRA